ncbi:hypothetical protein AB0383_16745 [Amycolatopsis sp. NPDC051373]|uniref:hypothetical protein n=1 Tax=Amycolatopsis sp. NPDC051373 TaxID=3155801 RepID=UPI00344E58BC
MSSYDDTPRRSSLPAALDNALARQFPDDTLDSYASQQALEVLDRVLPHVEDVGDVIHTLFPYDGPHSADTVADAARAMAKIGRYLNNATQRERTLPYGSSIGTVIGNVKATLFQLDQLLDQLASAALHLAEDPALYSDQVPYDADIPRAKWMAARHDADVTTAMQVADELHQIRPGLVTWDSQGYLPVGGIAHQLEHPHALANQLSHNEDEVADETKDA